MRAALEFFQHTVPGVVLLDYNMPDLTGLQVLDEMKKDPRLAAVPVILFTGYGDELRAEAEAKGVSAFIVKASLDWGRIRTEVGRFVPPKPYCGSKPVSPVRRIADAG